MIERESEIDLNKLGVLVGVLGHPVATKIIALMNGHPLSPIRKSEEKKDASRKEPPLEEVPKQVITG